MDAVFVLSYIFSLCDFVIRVPRFDYVCVSMKMEGHIASHALLSLFVKDSHLSSNLVKP